jgi:hypothetical protein
MEFSVQHLARIPHTLSEPRFATYLQHCDNNKDLALRVYQWNLELSSAFFVPLHLLEISIRNAVAESIAQVHTANWPWTNGFIRSLPSPQRAYNPQRNLTEVAHREHTTGKVVAELKFVFWEKMFTRRHDERIWNHHLRTAFPNAPARATIQNVREEILNSINTIRGLRNRIAHHEPIFVRDLQVEYNLILKLIQWRDSSTLGWLNDFEKVTALIGQKPT